MLNKKLLIAAIIIGILYSFVTLRIDNQIAPQSGMAFVVLNLPAFLIVKMLDDVIGGILGGQSTMVYLVGIFNSIFVYLFLLLCSSVIHAIRKRFSKNT